MAIAIVVIVTFVGVPLVMTLLGDIQGKGVSGASRLLDTSFSLARDQALRSNAAYGVRLVRDEANPWVANRLQYLESPPNYALGRVSVGLQFDLADNDGDGFSDETYPPDGMDNDGDGLIDEADELGLPDGFDSDGDGFIDEADELSEAIMIQGSATTQWLGLVHVGDHIRVNRAGPLYEVLGPDGNPRDGVVDALGNPPGSVLVVCAEPYPNRDGIGAAPVCGGFVGSQALVPYELYRRPVPADGQEEVLLPEGIVIDLLRSKGLPFDWTALVGPDGAPGVASADDDANGVTDDLTELGLGDDVRPAGWPPIDILFSPTGQVTGDAAQAAVMHLWIGPFGTTQSNLPDDLAQGRLFSLFTRGGNSQGNEIDGSDLNLDGVPDNPYSFAEQALGTTPE